MATINNHNSIIHKQIVNEFNSINEIDSIAIMVNKLKVIIDNDLELTNQQKNKAITNLADFSFESQKPSDKQNLENKKLSWDNFTEVVKFSTALSGLVTTIAKIAGVA